jgi:uncharacterized protein (TIGR02118 family)
MPKVIALYPQPTNAEQFDKDYVEHMRFFDEKMGFHGDVKPYTLTKFLPTPESTPPYYQMAVIHFDSVEDMQTALSSQGAAESVADAVRISTGGAPIIMIGVDM